MPQVGKYHNGFRDICDGSSPLGQFKKMFGENGHRSGCILIYKRIFFHFKQAAT